MSAAARPAQDADGATGLACPVCESDAWMRLFERLGWTFVRCEGCGLSRLDPIPSEAELAAHYARRTEKGGNYDLGRAAERDENLTRVLDFVDGIAPGKGTLLDVGCFDGGLLDIAAARGWDVWGLEPQPEAVRMAERTHPGRITQAPIEEAHALPSQLFDVITAISVIEHVRDPRALLTLARGHLRPGGVLIIHTPDKRSLPARALGRYWPPIAPPEHTFYFDRRTLRQITEKHDFVPLTQKRDVKRLRVEYVYNQFEFFGPEFHRLLAPVMKVLPRRVTAAALPFYAGELFYAARLPAGAERRTA